ncbi:DUF2218 domain-containing protein [Poseidonocella sedimentorum]|uniref:2,4-dihydroxyhept-2-ene-1,7-dioic acid aldolase n=1 Tax=Poseidonocella sedimentorum TaxID=871652 RepID=A0A1I6ERH0_9RHOB|nr:DUF2218 domain-containing protein [Poseidonocella sedimentorum]SFR20131.1 hypothetical protein SAMN04515673_1199 [Poseidonocella sedimentorum]
MIEQTGELTTINASRYLQQLCKHFGHKIEVSYSDSEGTCAFPQGRARLAAGANGLRVDVAAETADDLARVKLIVDSHLERFAFREGITGMRWQS